LLFAGKTEAVSYMPRLILNTRRQSMTVLVSGIPHLN